MAETIDLLVDGGKASAGPPLGPALGPLGVNVGLVVKEINEKTKAFVGMKVPVKLVVDPKTKEFTVTVGTPPASALIIKELGIEKGSGKAQKEFVASMTMAQVVKVSNMKKDSLLGHTTKARALEIIGTCVSMGIKVDGLPPKEVQRLIKEGKYDDALR